MRLVQFSQQLQRWLQGIQARWGREMYAVKIASRIESS